MMNYRIVFVLKCTLYVLELGLYLYQFPESDGHGAALEQKTAVAARCFFTLSRPCCWSMRTRPLDDGERHRWSDCREQSRRLALGIIFRTRTPKYLITISGRKSRNPNLIQLIRVFDSRYLSYLQGRAQVLRNGYSKF